AIIGTPAYLAPEQARGEKVDARSDLFSLGCVLYRMCTGELPFKGRDTLATLSALAVETPKPVAQLNPEVPAALSTLVARLLEKTPARRPPSARQVIEVLKQIEANLGIAPHLVPRRPAADEPVSETPDSFADVVPASLEEDPAAPTPSRRLAFKRPL